RLRKLGQRLPGPATVNPRDKVWNYLIAKYGFDKRALWELSCSDMERYIEARPPGQKPEEEDWRPASEALKIANERGYDITLDWIAKRKDRIRTRAPQQRGRHHLEVEMGSFAKVVFFEAKPKAVAPEPDETSPTNYAAIRPGHVLEYRLP